LKINFFEVHVLLTGILPYYSKTVVGTAHVAMYASS
jgi:hypothetical protein